MRTFTRAQLAAVAALVLMLSASWAVAQTPQTIIIDGINDFLPGNLVENDGADTEFPNIDIGEVYITNDAVNFYVGLEHDRGGWGSVQLGLAIDVNTVDGGTEDPWGRQIEWSATPNKPDFMFYINLDNNWQASYSWADTAWVTIAEGPGSLDWNTGTGFNELAIMLGSLGLSAGDVMNYEAWVTQDGATKGPLDAVANDASQLSTPGFTMWEVDFPIPMMEMHTFTVQASADPDPPVVTNVQPTSFPVDSFFDVYFNEPVDETSASVAGNYLLSGGDGDGHQATTAVPDASDPSIVHLTFDGQLDAAAALYNLTVSGVKDLAGNTIVENGVDNLNCFMLKDVTFRGLFGPFLNGQTEPFVFSVEGGKAPLTFDLCDSGMMADIGGDIWEYSTTFCVTGSCTDGTAIESFEWKFNFNCGTWEPLGSNRVHTLDLANGAADLIEVWWNDEDPSAFTAHDIDVEFFVDMSNTDYLFGDTVGINGSQLPLTHDVPSLTMMVDDGTGNDVEAGDEIFSSLVTFPAGSRKDVTYKFVHNDIYECDLQSDRNLFLNDEAFDVVGGDLGPLTLPLVNYDFCGTIWSAVEVVFSVDTNGTDWEALEPGDVISINGTPNNADPPTFDWTIPSLNEMLDDGVWPDAAADDKIFSIAVVFPDTSAMHLEYKYLLNDVYECADQPNRTLTLDPDSFDAVGNPQINGLDLANSCSDLSPVTPINPFALSLAQNMPNPFNPSTEIRFSVPAAGQGHLRVYNVRGEMVRSLLDGHFAAGSGSVVWNGRTDNGLNAGSGVYFYRLEVGGHSLAKRMVLLK